ncbi:integrin alpha [Actinopolymorpha sp. NPDC004070]|uniref:integrin alpha n=1 Tax=Actinopolymorpha sp. NPDC004070 TaxID=3154548 RepID=UPI0033AD903F
MLSGSQAGHRRCYFLTGPGCTSSFGPLQVCRRHRAGCSDSECAVIMIRIARFVRPLLVGAFLCATVSGATTSSAVAAESPCDPTDLTGFAVGLPTAPLPNGQSGTLGRVEVHNEVPLGEVNAEKPRGGRVILRASLGDEQQIGDRFGAAVAIADIDGDNCSDLVVGAPGVDGGGALYVIFGTRAGLGTGASLRIPLQARPGDEFGDALAVESVRSPTTQRVSGRIWIGAPGRDVSGQADAGAVAYTEVVDRVASAPRLYTQDTPGVPGRPEPGDRFGEELAALRWYDVSGGGVLVGQPSEDIGPHKDAGMVTVLPTPGAPPAGPGPYAVTQNTQGIPGAVEAGDRFGAAVDAFRDVGWVGVPGEDLGAVRDAGMVQGLRIGATRATSLSVLRQGKDSGVTIPGRPEAGDHFGASVRGGQLDYPDGDCNEAQVVIGVPGEDVGTVKDAGAAVSYFGHDRDPLSCLPGDGFSLGANARPGDHLGAAVGRTHTDSFENADVLLLGIPGSDVATAVDAGVVLKGRFPRTTQPQSVYTESDGALPGGHYGAVLSR